MLHPGPWLAPFIALIVGQAAWGAWARRCRQYRRPRQDREVAWLIWHWFTGGPWTWTVEVKNRDGTTTRRLNWPFLEPHQSASTDLLRRAPIAVTRTAATVAAAAVPAGIAGAVPLTVAVSVAAIGVTHVSVRRLFWLEWIAPAYEALLGVEGLKMPEEERRPGRWIRVTRDWQWHRRPRLTILGRQVRLPSRHADGINLGFPLNLRHTGKVKENIETTLATVLGLTDVTYRWFDKGRSSHLMILPEQIVPKKAPFRNPDIRAAIETALARNPTAPVIGLGRGDAPVAVDIDAESPHILISAGTIGGKSATVRSLVAQLLWADDNAIAVICDNKEHSQRGLVAVPGVVVARSAEEINNAIVAVWEEVQRRNSVCRDVPLGEDMPAFPRLILGLEEMNTTVKQLNGWWRRTNGTRAGQAPAIYALDNILCMGRAVRTNVILDGQAVNHRTAGGDAGAVNIALRILAEYDENTWKRLAHGTEYIPAVSHAVQPGWCVTVHGREVTECQRIYMTEEQVYAWLMALDNTDRTNNLPESLRDELTATPPATPRTPQAPGTPGLFLPATCTPSMQEISAESEIAENDDGVDYVTLRTLSEDPEIGMTLGALRKAAQAPGFPEAVEMPGGFEYSRQRVVQFLENRRRRRTRPTRGWVYWLVGGGQSTLSQLRATGSRMGQVKIGYTTRDPRVRAQEIAPYRPEDIVRLDEVDHPPRGQRLPDKEWHERFAGRDLAVHPLDETSELFWIRGEVAAELGVREEVSA